MGASGAGKREACGKIPTARKWVEACKLPRYEVLPPTGDPPESEAKRLRNATRVATAERAKARGLAATRWWAAVSSLDAACDGSVLDCDTDPAADRHQDHMIESATV